MTEFVPSAKGTNIRFPSSALLCLDSRDRIPGQTVFDINIVKPTNLMSGFFTRITITELQLSWSVPNISSQLDNNTFAVLIGSTTTTVTLPFGFYTVAQALDSIVYLLNLALGAATFSIQSTALPFGAVNLLKATGTFSVPSTTLADQLGFAFGAAAASTAQAIYPDLRPYDYLDFVSNQLTYCQNVKDGSSAPSDINVMCRLYFGWESSYTSYDSYGFPILFGYKPDRLIKQFATPKQIQWDNIQPIGNVSIQIYGRRQLGFGTVPIYTAITGITEFNTNYQLTLQISEV